MVSKILTPSASPVNLFSTVDYVRWVEPNWCLKGHISQIEDVLIRKGSLFFSSSFWWKIRKGIRKEISNCCHCLHINTKWSSWFVRLSLLLWLILTYLMWFFLFLLLLLFWLVPRSSFSLYLLWLICKHQCPAKFHLMQKFPCPLDEYQKEKVKDFIMISRSF